MRCRTKTRKWRTSRARSSLYARLQSEGDEKTSEMDVRTIVGRTLDRLSEREEAVVSLRAEVQALQRALAGRTKEQEFKTNNTPLPPPPVDRREVTVSKANKGSVESLTMTESVDAFEDVSPPPPPPPRLLFVNLR